MNSTEFVKKIKEVVENYKTLYVLGCFGSPMTASNKKIYITQHCADFNGRADRKAKIQATTEDTFGFDCVCLIKGVLWGWSGNKNKIYGGAAYASNGVPDIGADEIINVCSGVSTDFSNIVLGELLWMKGHVGVYIGDGLAVECTPKWKDGVQITAVHNIGKKSGYNGRKWTKHGKLPYIEYPKATATTKPSTQPKPSTSEYDIADFIRDVQTACGAKVDGIAGPETLSKTITVSAHYNKRHAVVKAIQKRLNALGYIEVGTADGVAGPKFTSAVAHFQQDNGCAIDGVITKNNKTWKKLLGLV